MNLNDLISQYASSEKTYTINVKGIDFEFRKIVSYDELEAISKETAAFVRSCRADTCHKTLKPYLPESDLTLVAIHGIHTTCLTKGENELTELALLKLQAGAAFVFNELKNKWEAGQGLAVAEAEAAAIEDIKND